jgi:hypothetical protein
MNDGTESKYYADSLKETLSEMLRV